MDERLKSFLREQFREAGREYARARDAYQSGRTSTETEDDTDQATDDEDGHKTDTATQKTSKELDQEPEAEAEADADADISVSSLPCDETGRIRIVCRRAADKRTVMIDTEARPSCFEPGHPDCEGCVRDIRDGIVETW